MLVFLCYLQHQHNNRHNLRQALSCIYSGLKPAVGAKNKKTESATVVDEIVFIEIGTKENFDDFFKLVDIVTDNHRETAGTPINVLAMDNKYALWMGYVSPEEIAKI